MLKKFKEYLLHNPYWGILHKSAENQTYVSIDASKFKGLSDNEKEILEVWNRLSHNMRRELATAVEDSIELDAEVAE